MWIVISGILGILGFLISLINLIQYLLSERSISLKMNGKVQWKQSEICKACTILQIDNANIPEYFFNLEVQLR